MLEITGKDISELNDADLRSLIGLLCEAEVCSFGIPTAGITYGGNQDAKDGGIDLRVELSSALHPDSYIPRSITGFQIKKPDMPRSAIFSEMQLNGELKNSIKNLVAAGGAYIIVSSQGSTADSALRDRKMAMQDALSDCPNAEALKVDFYDRERIAGWVRSHPALILWIRDKIGKSISGWNNYRNWANTAGRIEEEYLLDGQIRLFSESRHHDNGMSAEDGINDLRNALRKPGASIRLTGLSGVGKTRLIQALFDERVGENPLNQSQVFYTDIGNNPNPDPRSFAERFEYDVREDQPEETDVYCLEPASDEIIEKVVLSRYEHISRVDAHTIAEFSGGNARIAIALANTVLRDENLSKLKDEDLFKRLFQQRNEPDSSLMKSAEVCSLVHMIKNCSGLVLKFYLG